jgi:hypothetical protein
MLLKYLWNRSKAASAREDLFLSRTALLGTTGFLASGMFDYTYGHSLGLILLSFIAVRPLAVNGQCPEGSLIHRRFDSIEWLDRVVGVILFAASVLVVIPAALITYILSRRSPFIAHLRIGRKGDRFWVEMSHPERVELDANYHIRPPQAPPLQSARIGGVLGLVKAAQRFGGARTPVCETESPPHWHMHSARQR